MYLSFFLQLSSLMEEKTVPGKTQVLWGGKHLTCGFFRNILSMVNHSS